MHILHVIPGISPALGGPSKAVFEICGALTNRGIHSEIATTDAAITGHYQLTLDTPLTLNGVTTRCFRCNILLRHAVSIGITRWLRQNIRKYDVVHVHGLFSYVTLVAAHYCTKTKVPFVVRPAGQLDPWSLAQKAHLKTIFNWAIGFRILDRAAAIHATSDMEYEGIKRLGFGNKTSVVPLGVSINGGEWLERPLDDCLRIIFLGRIHRKKGLTLLLEAISELVANRVRIHLAIAGTGEPEEVSQNKMRITQLGLDKAVTFLGFLEGDAKDRALRDADVFVLPSYEENFGIAVLEAMANGLPVIVSDSVALEKQVREYSAGQVVTTGSVSALVDALKHASANRNEWRTMGENARQLVQQRFSWSEIVKSLISLYETLPVRRSVGV